MGGSCKVAVKNEKKQKRSAKYLVVGMTLVSLVAARHSAPFLADTLVGHWTSHSLLLTPGPVIPFLLLFSFRFPASPLKHFRLQPVKQWKPEMLKAWKCDLSNSRTSVQRGGYFRSYPPWKLTIPIKIHAVQWNLACATEAAAEESHRSTWKGKAPRGCQAPFCWELIAKDRTT